MAERTDQSNTIPLKPVDTPAPANIPRREALQTLLGSVGAGFALPSIVRGAAPDAPASGESRGARAGAAESGGHRLHAGVPRRSPVEDARGAGRGHRAWIDRRQGRAVPRPVARCGVGRRISARFSARSARSTWPRSAGMARRGSASRRREQDALLREASTADAKTSAMRGHFQNLKDWIAGAYYSSETGMRELGWTATCSSRSCPGARTPAAIRTDRGQRASAMQTTRFDVIVVGSGASGGWAAKRLSEAGIKVALLEAGKPQGDADFTEHVPAYDLTYRDQGERVDPPHAPAAARLLCLPRVELQVVRQRSRRALHHAGRQAVQLAGPHARRRRAHQRLGPAVVPVQRSGPARQVVRRLRRGLADLPTRISCRTTSSSRTTSASRDRPRTCRSCPTAASIRRCR